MEERKERAQVFYSGQVQGVGFRWMSERLARRFLVTGWAKNLSDGRVELMVEGHGEDVRKFLQAIRDSEVGDGVLDADVNWSIATGEFKEFTIAY